MTIFDSELRPDPSADGAFLAAVKAEADAAMIEESRRGVRLVLPFLVPTIFMMWVVVGEGARTPAVQLAFAGCVATVVVRLGSMYATLRSRAAAGFTTRSRVALTASSWSTAAALGAVYLTLGPEVTVVQWMTLALIATAVCAVGLLTATSSVLRFTGYVAIQLSAFAYALHRTGDPALHLVALFALLFVVMLSIIARKNVAAVREKTLLALRMRDLGLRDGLTGLRNRAFAEELLDHRAAQITDQWSERGRRQLEKSSGRRLALVMIDLDHFKKVNDVHGHDGGDAVLASFARTAQSVVRQGDVVARWGGEEFLLILEVHDMVAAHAIAERVREEVAATPVVLSDGRSIAVTCSIGATPFPLDVRQPMAETWRETLKRADSSLYRAKALGRNRTAWTAPATTTPGDGDGDGDGLEWDDAPTMRYRKAPADQAA